MEKGREVDRFYIVFFMSLSFLLFAVMGGIQLLGFGAEQEERETISEYVSLGEEAAAGACIWLNRIEDMPLSYAQVREMMGDIVLEVLLIPSKEQGSYTRKLADGAAEACMQKAQEGLEKAYREVVRYRFREAGYEGEITDDFLDERMREAYGVSISEYLTFCEVRLLPEREELEARYQGEVSYE